MFRLVVVLSLVGLALAGPPVSRSRDQIEAFRQYLESTQTNNGQKILSRSASSNPEENSGRFDGDIVLDDEMIQGMVEEYAMGRNAYTFPTAKWPNDTVVWEFGEGEFGPLQSAAIEAGIKDIEDHSCVKFRKRLPGERVYVRLTGEPSGCYAHVGYSASRGVHTYNVARNTPGLGCFRHATIVHEWLHILGFLHMQSTHDRDDYVRIATENLQPGTENNFEIYSAAQVSNLGIEYDYVSCMHYGPFAFSINGRQTIIPLKEHEGDMGQRVYITDSDWKRLNRHFNCPGAWD